MISVTYSSVLRVRPSTVMFLASLLQQPPEATTAYREWVTGPQLGLPRGIGPAECRISRLRPGEQAPNPAYVG